MKRENTDSAKIWMYEILTTLLMDPRPVRSEGGVLCLEGVALITQGMICGKWAA